MKFATNALGVALAVAIPLLMLAALAVAQ